MTAQADEPVRLTWDEYIKFEEVYEGRRHELVRGHVRVMAGASERHDILVQLINAELLAAFRDTPCRVFVHNRKIKTGEDTGYYPDVLVRCGPAAHRLYETDARFVVEVLSPSNNPADVIDRPYAYQHLPSIETILFVNLARRVATVHGRKGDHWEERQVFESRVELGEAQLDFASLWRDLDAEASTD